MTYFDCMSKKNETSGESTEIEEVLDDGGGCTEAWEAMSEIRNEDASSEMNRRSVLKKTAVSAVVGGSAIAGTASAAAENKTEVKILKGEEKQNVVNTALEQEEVEALRSEIDYFSDVDKDSTQAKRVALNNKSATIVKLSFNLAEKQDAHIIWSNKKAVQTLGIVEFEGKSAEAINYQVTGDSIKTSTVNKESGAIQSNQSGTVSTQQMPTYGPCGMNARLDGDCLEKTIEENEEQTQSCTTCYASLISGVSPVTVVACGWCAYDIWQNEWYQPCDLCEQF